MTGPSSSASNIGAARPRTSMSRVCKCGHPWDAHDPGRGCQVDSFLTGPCPCEEDPRVFVAAVDPPKGTLR